jgi:glycosyltransferase involved in cell wall biosynthesis
MTKKYNLLYDATIFANSYIKGSSNRTGIFFAAYNILKYFADDPRFDITLYVHDSLFNVRYFKNDILLSRYNVIYSKETALFNINVHKNNIKTAGNIIKKIIYSLKIIKNYFVMIIYHRDNSSLLKQTDIFFSPMRPVITELTNYTLIKHFIVLHDMIPVIYYKDSINLNNDHFSIIIKSLNKNTYYFCNSHHTKNDFLKYYGNNLDEKKMLVIHHATSQNFYPDYNKIKLTAALDKYKIKYKNNHKYIFSLCNLEPRKNLLFTVKCFIKFISKHNIHDLFFYLGGSKWDEFIHQLEKEMDKFNEYRDKITGLGYIDDVDINILYSNSLFFTFISKYEGFGVPPLEAMQSGTPVITSNNSSLPEVVGDAAIMIDPDSEEQCIKAFEDIYFNEDLRKKYIEKGLERVKLFSWEKTVAKMKEVILETVK